MSQHPVPFKTLLTHVLEPNGYTLVRIFGRFRYFDPPRVPGRAMRRIGFPVEPGEGGGWVRPEHVQQIIDIIEEDKKGPAR